MIVRTGVPKKGIKFNSTKYRLVPLGTENKNFYLLVEIYESQIMKSKRIWVSYIVTGCLQATNVI